MERTIRRGHEALVRRQPAPIGVCAINPHAGEDGLFGHGEEEPKIVPAIEALRADGIDVHGPLAADTAFFLAGRGDYDLIVAMYHDQGHGPVKVLGIEAGVNITVGLPVIRTSVDHGTAFDIAGKGIADERSMVEALRQATELATARAPSDRREVAPPRESQARRAEIVRLAQLQRAGQCRRTVGPVRRHGLDDPPRSEPADRARSRRPHLRRRHRAGPATRVVAAPTRGARIRRQAGDRPVGGPAGATRERRSCSTRAPPSARWASYLGDTRGLTVVTAGLTALEALADADAVRLECSAAHCGTSATGLWAPSPRPRSAPHLRPRVPGADAVTAELGICEAELEQTRLKELMIPRADDVCVLAHAKSWAADPSTRGRRSRRAPR